MTLEELIQQTKNEVELLTSTSAKAVIPKLDAIFARQGVPDILKSDNGPPFNGHEFEKFANHLPIQAQKNNAILAKSKWLC